MQPQGMCSGARQLALCLWWRRSLLSCKDHAGHACLGAHPQPIQRSLCSISAAHVTRSSRRPWHSAYEVVPCCLPMSTPSQYCVGVNIRQVHTGHSSSAATAIQRNEALHSAAETP